MTDYTGSPISLRNIQTGHRVDGIIVALSEREIKISANRKVFTISQDRKGHWLDKVSNQKFAMA